MHSTIDTLIHSSPGLCGWLWYLMYIFTALGSVVGLISLKTSNRKSNYATTTWFLSRFSTYLMMTVPTLHYDVIYYSILRTIVLYDIVCSKQTWDSTNRTANIITQRQFDSYFGFDIRDDERSRIALQYVMLDYIAWDCIILKQTVFQLVKSSPGNPSWHSVYFGKPVPSLEIMSNKYL